MKPTPLTSSVAPGDGMIAPLRVVLHESSTKGEWVTHIENMQVGGLFWGRYHDDYESAHADYFSRCVKYEVEPLTPSEHTKSPWEVITSKPYVNDGKPAVFAISGTLRVASISGYLGELDANAHLIAAAPELLEACKTVLASGLIQGSKTMTHLVSAAISKATPKK